MSKAVDTKKKEVKVEIKTPEVETVAVAEVEKPFITAADIGIGKPHPRLLTAPFPLEKANVELIDKVEREQILEVALADYYKSSLWRNGESEKESSSSLIINGEKIEPLIAGVQRNFENVASSFGRAFVTFNPFRKKRRMLHGEPEVLETFDIYVYKIKRPKTGRGWRSLPIELEKLMGRLSDEYMYQIIMLATNATMTITSDFTQPSPWGEDKIWGGPLGLATVRNSEVTNVIFNGMNAIDNAIVSDCTMLDSVISDEKDWRSNIKNVDLEKSLVTNSQISLNGEHNWQRLHVIDSSLMEYRFGGKSGRIDKSNLEDVSTNGTSIRISKSRLSKMSLYAKEMVSVKDTVLHNQEMANFNTGDDIIIRSIFDATVMRYSNTGAIYIVRGRNAFWCGGWNDEGNLRSIELKSPGSENTNPGFRYQLARYGDADYTIEHMGREHITAYINGDIGPSEISKDVINNIVRTINERVKIANSIGSVDAIRESGHHGVW